ncbi:MAG: response regulator [Planctomycetota bacterium]|nr:response regulator [Planctomycetota bacterium]
MLHAMLDDLLRLRLRGGLREKLRLLEQLGHMTLEARLGREGDGADVILDCSLVPWKDEPSVMAILRELSPREQGDREREWLRHAVAAQQRAGRRYVYRVRPDGAAEPLAGEAAPADFAALFARSVLRPHLERALDGERVRIPAEWFRPAGAEAPERLLSIEMLPVGEGGGRAEDVLALVEDITERRLEEEAAFRDELRSALALFSGALLGEFNNFLGVIMAQASALRLSTGGRLAPPAAGAILDAAEEAAALLRRCAELGLQTESQTRLIDLNAAVKEAARLLSHLLAGRVRVQLELADELPRIRGNEALLRAMLLALGRLAEQAMPAGGTLSLRTAALEPAGPASPPAAALTVGDTGMGMDPLVRAEALKSLLPATGSGLGDPLDLAIARAVIRRHRGQVDLESAPGRGTVWKIVLPGEEARPNLSGPEPHRRTPADSGEAVQALARVAGDARLGSGEAPLAPAHVPVLEPPGSGWILVVDDEENFRDYVRGVLNQNGFEVACACDGREACEIFQEDPGRYALAILDAYMPRMGGLETYLRMQVLRPDLPVLFVSGFVRGPSRHALLAGCPGQAEVVLKPFGEDRLLEAVRRLLKGGKVRA